jgi:[acyl-carrier-protein] S-malonyltransferase
VIGWMFPGQGSQRPGMAADLAACEGLFEAARPILGADLARISTAASSSGWPAHLLQPALYTTCVGAIRALEERGLSPDAVVGHSLGEYAALVAAGMVSFEDGLRLVAVRGRAMAAAGRANPGGMAAVVGLGAEAVEESCSGIEGVWVANFNSSNQIVISGRDEPLARAAEACRQAGAMRVIRLDVPMPSHTPLMEPAAREVAAALGEVVLKEPTCPFYSAVDAAPHTDPSDIVALLARAITSKVRFAETLTTMAADGVEGLVEVGPGKVLCGLVRHTLPGFTTATVATDGEAEALVFPSRTRGARPSSNASPQPVPSSHPVTNPSHG